MSPDSGSNLLINAVFAIGVLFIVVILYLLISLLTKRQKVFKNNKYAYIAKELPMTRAEAEFFTTLGRVVDERYYVFPQVHLSSILKPTASDKDYLYAFRHINGKSVDFVLCDKVTLRPTYAIELDDYTHSQSSRRKRDAEVERIFDEANLPLVRFKNKNASEADIINALVSAKQASR